MVVELHWCSDCGAETGLERPAGLESPEGACVDCGSAIFLFVELLDESEPFAALAA